MNRHQSFFPLVILVFSLGCSDEIIDHPTDKGKESMEAARTMGLSSSPGSSLMMFYKAASSNDIHYSQILPNNEKCTTLDKRLRDDGETPQSSESPSQAYYNGKLYIVHKGGATNNIYYNYFDGEKWLGDKQITVNGTNIQSSKAPAAVVYNNKLYIVYKGGSTTSVYYSYFDGVSWKGDTRIAVNGNNIGTTHSPAAVVFNSKLHLFYKAGNSNYVYSSYLDGTTWKGNTKISVSGNNLETTHSPAAAMFNNKLYLVYKGNNTSAVYCSDWNGVSWSGNTRIKVNGNDIFTSNSPSATILNNTLYIAYRAGSSPDIYLSSFDGQVWRGDNRVYGIGTSSFANIIPNPFDLKPFITQLLSISPTAKKVYFSSSHYYPYGDSNDDSHVQGIQVTDNGRFLISSSNFILGGYRKGLIIPIKNGLVETHSIKITEGYGHAGGIQYSAGTLAVALATTHHPTDVSKKWVRFYTEDTSGNFTELPDIEVNAGNSSAVGFVDINETQRLVVVNTNNDMDMVYQVITKVNNVWSSDFMNWVSISHPDANEKVQNINLFKEGDLYYLIGLRNADIVTEQKRDALDIYTFTINDTEMSELTLLGSMFVNGDDYQRMRAGGGVNIKSNGDIIVTSYGKRITPGEMVIWTYTK